MEVLIAFALGILCGLQLPAALSLFRCADTNDADDDVYWYVTTGSGGSGASSEMFTATGGSGG